MKCKNKVDVAVSHVYKIYQLQMSLINYREGPGALSRGNALFTSTSRPSIVCSLDITISAAKKNRDSVSIFISCRYFNKYNYTCRIFHLDKTKPSI